MYLNKKQKEFMTAKERFVAYGGARGGGKSFAVRYKAMFLAMKYAGIRILLVRRTYGELKENHIRLMTAACKSFATYNDSEKCLSFKNGSKIKFGYCDNESDVTRYQGIEFDVLFIDEATQLTKFQFDTLNASVRGVNDFPKRTYLTCNPGGVGHSWVKRLFIDKEYEKSENASDYRFIKATVFDNKALLEKDGEKAVFSYDKEQREITVSESFAGKIAEVSHIKTTLKESDVLLSDAGSEKLTYFVFGGRLYFLSGSKYYVFDGKTAKEVSPYIPTTYIGITAKSIGQKLDEKNVLTGLFYNTFSADGETKEFYLSENDLVDVVSVEVYGESVTNFEKDPEKGKITFETAPKSGAEAGFEEGYSGIKVLAKAKDNAMKETLLSAKFAKPFEGAVILAGAKDFGGIYFSAIDSPEYFPEINYSYIGEGVGEITGLTVCGNELFAYYSDNSGGGIYKIKSLETGIDDSPQVFAAELVSSTEKIIYGGIDFADLPTFLTSNGVFALASPNLKLERVVEKRSTLIDPRLKELDLKNAKLFSFGGYFCVYASGDVFMGDSRKTYRNERGECEFEWFRLCDIGAFEDCYKRFVFSAKKEGIESKYFASEEFVGKTANAPQEDGSPENAVYEKTLDGTACFVCLVKSKEPAFSGDKTVFVDTANEYVVEEKDDFIGGVFRAASDIQSFDENVYFSCKGVIYSFNFDKKRIGEEDIYDFDGRTICSSLYTKLDNLGYPDMKKSTLKNSLVIKLKTTDKTLVKVKVRSESKDFRLVGEINASRFDFAKLDFASVSFNTAAQKFFVLSDGEKGFLEKQLAILSDEYKSHVKLDYISYRYKVVGKIRNKRSNL